MLSQPKMIPIIPFLRVSAMQRFMKLIYLDVFIVGIVKKLVQWMPLFYVNIMSWLITTAINILLQKATCSYIRSRMNLK